MKFKLKKFFYLLNDASNIALGKEVNRDKELIKRQYNYIILLVLIVLALVVYIVVWG